MIEQYLSNTNKSAAIPILQKKMEVNKVLVSICLREIIFN